MGFGKKEYAFLEEIGLGPRNPGCYVNGSWKGSGPLVSSVNPANNQVLLLLFTSTSIAQLHLSVPTLTYYLYPNLLCSRLISDILKGNSIFGMFHINCLGCLNTLIFSYS